MTILKKLKNNSIEIFISYHPTILKFKREAKELHKTLKSQNVSLMQCQEIIVKRNGFNNWHHLQKELKKFYEESLDTYYLKVSNDLEINDSYILGYDKIFNHYKYQSLELSLTNRLFMGKGVVRNYDDFIAKQSIRMGCPVLFISNKDKDGITAFDDIISYSKRIGKIENVKKIGANDYNLLNNFNMFPASLLAEMFLTFVSEKYFNKEKKEKLISFALFFFQYAKNKQSKDSQFILSLEKMRDILTSKEYMNDEDIPKDISSSRNTWLEHREQEIENIFEETINSLINLKLFSFNNNAISLNLLNNRNDIYLVLENNLICKFMAILLKLNMGYQLGYSIDGQEYIDYRKKKPYCVFLRNVKLPKGFAVVPAQARAIKISINLAYDDIEDIKDVEFLNLIAGTNLRYLSHDCFNKMATVFNMGLKTVSYNKYITEIDSEDYVNMIYKDVRYIISNSDIKL